MKSLQILLAAIAAQVILAQTVMPEDDSPPSDATDGSSTGFPIAAPTEAFMFPEISADTSTLSSAPSENSTAFFSPNTTTPTENDGLSYYTLTDKTHSLQLSGSSSGSLTLVSNASADGGSTFASAASIIYGDAQDRLFHLYAPLMSTYGVSRFRLAALTEMPLTSQLLTLVPIDHDGDPSTPAVLVAADTQGGAYYLFSCVVAGENKVFVVQDPGTGAEVLGSEEVRFSVTGGLVEGCGPIALTTPQEGFGV